MAHHRHQLETFHNHQDRVEKKRSFRPSYKRVVRTYRRPFEEQVVTSYRRPGKRKVVRTYRRPFEKEVVTSYRRPSNRKVVRTYEQPFERDRDGLQDTNKKASMVRTR